MVYPSANDVLNDAAIELGLVSQPVADFYASGVVDPNLILLRGLLSSLGRQLVRAYNWTTLQLEHAFTTVAGQSVYPLPEDYDRVIVSTEWDRTNSARMNGSLMPAGWQALKAEDVTIITPLQFRIRTGAIEVYPDTDTPGGIIAAFEYISGYWATKVDLGVPTIRGPAPTRATDLCYYDRSLLVAGLKYRYRASRGMDGTFEVQEFRDLLALAKGADRPGATIPLTGSAMAPYADPSLPDTGWAT